jgi:hypothetical protein
MFLSGGYKFPWVARIKPGGLGFHQKTKQQPQGDYLMRSAKLALLASVSMLIAAPALAQAPQVQVEKNISMAMSLAIIQGALEQCTKDGYKVSITIVDKGGNVAAQLRGDGTSPHTMEFSRLKAYTARTRN